MRKLKLQMQISIDGFVAGPNGEMDWMIMNWDDELNQFITALTDSSDCILLGRKLAEGFIPAWENYAKDPAMADFAPKFVATPKIVFSKTLKPTDDLVKSWNHTTLSNNDLKEEVNKLKNEPGKDLIAYGGGNFVSNLIKEELIDDLYLLVDPTALGNGMAIFKERTNLKLIFAKQFSCGIVIHHYQHIKK